MRESQKMVWRAWEVGEEDEKDIFDLCFDMFGFGRGRV